MSDLFRKEVVEKQGQKLFGDVVLSSPFSHKAITALLAITLTSKRMPSTFILNLSTMVSIKVLTKFYNK